MPTTEFQLDEFLDATPVGMRDLTGPDGGSTDNSGAVPFDEPGYEGSIDYRIRQLSYSSLVTLHSCPRKYQLYKLGAGRSVETTLQSITFAFGHVVGEAIQLALEGKSEEYVIWNTYVKWKPDIFAADDRSNKSLWSAILAIKRFFVLRAGGFLQDYELVEYNGRPACELSFVIVFPDGFRYRGHVDAVLRHKITGEILVLECKTTGAATLNPAMYKNSAQAIGYSIVLDAIFPDLSSYKVLYLVYQTKNSEFTPIPFTKSYLQRVLWIRELLLDIETIKLYEEAGVYPMHGESCVTFAKETEKESKVWEGDCEYLQTCTLGTDYLTKPMTAADADDTEYQVSLSLMDLLDSQMAKTAPATTDTETTLENV